MNKKLFLTSIFAIAFACPAMAVDGNATIENGDTCNIDNLGTSENNSIANIEAIWTLQSIQCPAGTSFNASTASCDTCSAGSWCVAGTYDVENNQTGAGATLCSTLSNGDFPLSETGATTNTACYRNCANADVAHATQVSGAYYYGDNNQCSATECAAGWHVKEGNADLSNVDTSSFYNKVTSAFIRNGSFTSDFGGINHDREYWGWSSTDDNIWAIEFSDTSAIQGTSVCSTINDGGVHTEMIDESGVDGAKHCWCQMTGYRETPSSPFKRAYSSRYFFVGTNWYRDDGCSTESCAGWCAGYMHDYRSSAISSVVPSLATCEANNIALQWYNDTVTNNGTKITPNNDAANQCTYNETITVPTNEMQKPGYTFGGWKLRTNN